MRWIVYGFPGLVSIWDSQTKVRSIITQKAITIDLVENYWSNSIRLIVLESFTEPQESCGRIH